MPRASASQLSCLRNDTGRYPARAPHRYTTDRFCVVVSGTWWCNSGADFDPAACVPVPAGSFVHRVAGTPHYDGVVRGHSEPAIIAICGVGPVNFALIDPSQPGVRRV